MVTLHVSTHSRKLNMPDHPNYFINGRAVVATAPNQVDLQTVRIPAPGDEDVQVQVTHSWISNGTESSYIRGERIAGDTARKEGDPWPFPHVPGYQKCGIVEAVGSKVRGIDIGARVFVTVSKVEGMFWDYGGPISPAVAHQSQIWQLPDEVSDVAAGGLVLTQVGYNCGIKAPVAPGDRALVIGDGMVGHWAAQTLAWRGARVALLGRHYGRLQKFDARSVDLRINSKNEDVSQVIARWAPDGLQVMVDTVGALTDLKALLPQMRANGHLVSAGFYGENGLIDIQPLRTGEQTLHAPSGWNRERMDATLELLAQGVLQTEHLITHRFPIERAAEAYELILSRREPVLGIVLDWNQS